MTADTLKRLKPKGSDLSKDAQVIRIGNEPARPEGYKTAVIEGDDPYERAAAIDRFFSAAKGKPSDERGRRPPARRPSSRCRPPPGPPAPATRCCSRKRNTVPAATRKALREHDKPNIFVLGPDVGDLEEGREGPRQARQGHPDPGPEPGGERDRVRPLRAGRLRLGRGRPRLQLHRGGHRRGRSTPPPRRRWPPRACSRPCCSPTAPTPSRARWRLPPQRAARLRGRPRPGGLQPRLDPRATTSSCRSTPRPGWTRSPS